MNQLDDFMQGDTILQGFSQGTMIIFFAIIGLSIVSGVLSRRFVFPRLMDMFSKTERIPNTFMAHRLLWKAEQCDLQTELSEALFEAYFSDGLNIGSKQILAQISESVGMDKKEIINFLDSKEGGQEIADLEMNFIEKSIGAVPTYFINEKYIIQGGQEPETFVSFLRKIIQINTSRRAMTTLLNSLPLLGPTRRNKHPRFKRLRLHLE